MAIEINGHPIEVAASMTKADLKKLIRECKKYPGNEWLDRCRICFENYLAGNMELAGWWSSHAEYVRPE